VTLDDAHQLKGIYSPDVAIADDLLTHVVEIAHGSVRRLCVNLVNIQEHAMLHGLDAIDRANWGRRRGETTSDSGRPIRKLRTDFNMIDLAAKADTDIDTAKTYLQALEKAGHIEVVQENHGHTDKRWNLLRITGWKHHA
jgi:predicted ArsR family transcriptional regulator